MSALELHGITAAYGETTVLRDVSVTVPDGAFVALLGPNGAGKTTLLRTAAGLLKPKRGTVTLDGSDLAGQPFHKRARSGLTLIPEGRGIYPSLTVRENLALHAGPRRKNADLDSVHDLFPVLRRRSRQLAGTMSGGEQQMLALARAFVTSPRIVLVDELSMGLAPIIVHELFQSLTKLSNRGVALLVVEQYASQVLQIAQSAYVLNNGRIVYSGTAANLSRDAVMEQYLGGSTTPPPDQVHAPGTSSSTSEPRRRSSADSPGESMT